MGMIKDANPADTTEYENMPSKQTVELRSPDGSADLYKLFAGLVIGAEHGLTMKDSLKKAQELYVDYNIFSEKANHSGKKLESLPASCSESADALIKQREIFEKDGIFPAGVIENVAAKLKAFNDKGLSEKLYNRHDELGRLVSQYLHCS
jgi:glutamine synthetase